MPLTAFYHGCSDARDLGHQLYDPSMRSWSRGESQPDFPLPQHLLDGGLLPPNQPQEEGLATLVHLNGWTILAFWDRSADQRGNSNSAFLIKGTLAFQEMVARCRYHFPKLWERFTFEVKLRDAAV